MALGLQLVGSFQSPSAFFHTEDPADEAWRRAGRFGTNESIARLVPNKAPAQWAESAAFAKVRIGQALEFRAASLDKSLLTAPLSLYYAFLSILRGFMAIRHETLPAAGHGLRFVKSSTLLESKAVLDRGTFTDYLDSCGVAWPNRGELSLLQALGYIPELAHDLWPSFPRNVLVQLVHVQATTNGVRLNFPHYPRDFDLSWREDFPALAAVCTRVDTATLEVVEEQQLRSDPSISRFLNLRLLPRLSFGFNPLWYSYRALDPGLKLSRSSYYFVAMFILGSAVRYEPELVAAVSKSDSELGWLLQRFVSQADRYFPQLMLWELHDGNQIYFGSNGM